MKDHISLTVTSLFAIVLTSFHFADDIVRGFEPGGFSNAGGILILSVWLYATLALAHRRFGVALMLLASTGAALLPLIHMRGAGLVGGRVANSSGKLFFVWTLMAVGAAATVSVVLSARRWWSLHRARAARV